MTPAAGPSGRGDGATPAYGTDAALTAAVDAQDAERCRLNEAWHGGWCAPASVVHKANIAPMILAGVRAYNAAAAPDMVAVVDAAQTVLDDIDALIGSSAGVAGLHLNGDLATWDELTDGGRFEGWLRSLERLREKLTALAARQALARPRTERTP